LGKTGWICQIFGSWRWEFVSLEVRTLNGPWRRGASLALGWVVLTLVPSSHTSWLGENCCDGEGGPFHFITSIAT